MRSIAAKLTITFLAVSTIGVVLVALIARWTAQREFAQLWEENIRVDFLEDVTAYYAQYGAWDGLLASLPAWESGSAQTNPPASQNNPPRPAPPPQRQQNSPNYFLVDMDGVIITPGGTYQPGQIAPAPMIAQGYPVEIDGETVGVIIAFEAAPPLGRAEEESLAHVNQSVFWSAAIAAGLGLAVSLVLARALTRPIRDLTRAARKIAAGELDQQVKVRGRDELSALAAAFNQMSADLDRAHRLRRQMTADIAHDLRSPLMVISGHLEGLIDDVLDPTPERFQVMYHETQELQRLVADLRTLSLADAGELPLYRSPTPPQELLERAASSYRPQAQQQGVTLAVDAPANLPALNIDPQRMAQVLGNLISNALRYTPQGGAIHLSASAVRATVTLTIQDTGAGIPPDDLPHIFDRFYRVDVSRASESGQSGLGLTIAKSLVEAHGGAISAQSVLGAGATMTIALPV